MSALEGAERAVAWIGSFFQTVPGVLTIGTVLVLIGLFAVHRTFADSLFQKMGHRAFKGILKQSLEKLASMQIERDEAVAERSRLEADLTVARPDHLLLEDLRTRLRQMKAVWLNQEALEEECRSLLEQNQWVLLPDYAVESNGLLREVALKTVLKEDFPGQEDQSGMFKAPPSSDLKVDLSGWVRGRSALDGERLPSERDAPAGDRFYLIIELKRPSLPIDRVAVEQAHAYAHGLMLMAPDALWGKRIDCLVIGGSIAADLTGAHLRWGPTQHAAVRIIPMTYRELFTRARIIATTFLPAEGAEDLIEPVFDPPVEAAVAEGDGEPPLELTEIAEPEAPAPAAPEPKVETAADDNPIGEKHRALQGLLDRFHGRKKEPAEPV